MKHVFTTLIFSFFSLLALAQDHFVIANTNNTFTPADITIAQGETVEWSNNGGFHNVNGSQAAYPDNPEGFSNGGASSSAWTFTHTFNTPGFYQYHCDPHLGLDMVGTVTVEAVSSAETDLVITEINYNNPGIDDYEFLELHNKGANALDLTGYQITSGFDFTFPNYTLEAGEYVVIAVDSALFAGAFPSVDVFEMDNNNLNNSGEKIQIEDALGNVMDSLSYSDGNGWPSGADGQGPSLVLCDPEADNSDPGNWQACFTPSGFFEPGGVELIVNPGAESQCISGPVVGFASIGETVLEDVGSVEVGVYIQNGNANATIVEFAVAAGSTTDANDVTLPALNAVTFLPGVAQDTQFILISITDDMLEEGFEDLILELTDPTNDALIAPLDDTYTLSIQDDDVVNTGSLVITGVFDAQPSISGTKGFELKALEDIPDLSIYGVSSANNGNGPTGEPELTFPALSLEAGACIYVADDSTDFVEFFGFPPDFVDGAANINGDDAIELFENGFVIDVFGDVDVDGNGQPWEYLDGWAYRKNATGPDGSTFILDNWTFSGVDALEGFATNAEADLPFPICTYLIDLPDQITAFDDNAFTDVNTPTTIDVLANDFLVDPIISLNVIDQPTNGAATVNGLDDITYTPDQDFCGDDSFTYEICDGNDCDTATVQVDVACPPSFPLRSIGEITADDDGDLVPDSLGKSVEIRGVVHSPNYRPGDLEFFLIDGQNDGIAVFSFEDLDYTVEVGDSLHVRGILNQFNGLNQFGPVEIELIAQGRDLFDPTETNVLDESTESQLVVTQTAMSVVSSETAGGGVNFFISDGVDTLLMRVDNDIDVGTLPPLFKVVGMGSQFDTDTPYDDDYQMLPRSAADIIPITGTVDPTLAGELKIWPNPFGEVLRVESAIHLDRLQLHSLQGELLFSQKGVQGLHSLRLGALPAGSYVLTVEAESRQWSVILVKE